jgi:hypothetical protein
LFTCEQDNGNLDALLPIEEKESLGISNEVHFFISNLHQKHFI